VTLGDEEARRRGTQKTVLERKAPPTFDVLVEQEERNLVGVHHEVAAAVDGLLRGEAPQREMRERQPDGSMRRWMERAAGAARADGVGLPGRGGSLVQREELAPRRPGSGGALMGQGPLASRWWEERRDRERLSAGATVEGPGGRWLDPELARGAAFIQHEEDLPRPDGQTAASTFRKRRIYPMGINRNRLEQAIHELGLPAVITKDEQDADAFIVLKSLYRTQPARIDAAQSAGLPVYVLRGTSVERLREALADMFRADVERARQAADDNADEE
jgi:hypothetical protein